jgi:hypothetical protein
LEPDTWGYVIQANQDPTKMTATINNLGGEWAYLSDLPNNYSGLARAMIRVVKKNAPDAYAGLLMAHWEPHASTCPGVNSPKSSWGMPYWSREDIDCSVGKIVDFANQLLPKGSADRGDFIGVEKNGHSAGYWKVLEKDDSDARRYYWGDTEMTNFLHWSKTLGQGVDLPVLGWQISIGHMGLRNSCENGPLGSGSGLMATGNCAFEDTFFEHFFGNVSKYIDAGFIGMLVGKGLGDDTDYTHANADPTMGDQGWFFNKLKTFDKGRPYLGNTSPIRTMESPVFRLRPEPNGLWVEGPLQNEVRLVDAHGQIQSHAKIHGQKAYLDLKGLAPGQYWIQSGGLRQSWLIR